jgi:hypothetical protein
MLHAFFFALSYLTDYRTVAEAFGDGVRLGLINAWVVCVAVGWLVLRGRMAAGSERGVNTKA